MLEETKSVTVKHRKYNVISFLKLQTERFSNLNVIKVKNCWPCKYGLSNSGICKTIEQPTLEI